MFVDLKIKNVDQSIQKWNSDDVASYKARKDKVLVDLEQYLLDGNNLLDATKIQQSVFPEIDIDVFISHSHTDEDEAIKVALSLEEIGLKPFVDSCVWGHADELLRKIDDAFSKPEGWTNYSYELRNRTTTNVHLILNAALQQMIHRSELFIFLGTETSVKIDDYVSSHEQLSSPWIFSELTFVRNVERTLRKQITMGNESRKFEAAASDKQKIEFRYRLPDSTYSIEFWQFARWLEKGKSLQISDFFQPEKGLEHLDRLYRELNVHASLLSAPRFDWGQ